jgi:hypothetical protein
VITIDPPARHGQEQVELRGAENGNHASST